MIQTTLGELAKLVGGEVVGDPNIPITGIAGIREAKPGDITFVANSRYASLIHSTRASAVIVGRSMQECRLPAIVTDDPYVAFTKVMKLLNGDDVPPPKEIHPTAVIGENVRIGRDVSIGPYVVIGDNAVIGDRVALYPHVYVGRKSTIGDDTLIYPSVTIREKIHIGKRVIIHSGTVIGGDGFGFAPVKGTHHKVPQVGRVVIEDDVEIGSNVTIDRATIGKTVIGRGTKIDNLVQIAHNVVLGENCIVVAQVGISGSAQVGSNVTIAGQAGIVGHIRIGDNTVVAARAGVTKDIPSNQLVSGFPAKPHTDEKRIKACLMKLPDMRKELADLRKRIQELESAMVETAETAAV